MMRKETQQLKKFRGFHDDDEHQQLILVATKESLALDTSSNWSTKRKFKLSCFRLDYQIYDKYKLASTLWRQNAFLGRVTTWKLEKILIIVGPSVTETSRKLF